MYDESKYLQVRGAGVVVSGGATAKTTVTWIQEQSTGTFTKVPANTRLIIMDFVYLPQGDLTSNHVINVAETIGGGDTIILQLFVDPRTNTQVHFLTGFVIGPGSSVYGVYRRSWAGRSVCDHLPGWLPCALPSAKELRVK
jgi:hypothetical protein